MANKKEATNKTETKNFLTKEQIEKAEKLLERPPIWEPEVNENIFGVIENIKMVTVRNEKDETESELPLATIVTNEGVKQSIWIGTVLEKRFSENEVVAGTIVGIKYLGKAGKSPKEYNNYDLVVID